MLYNNNGILIRTYFISILIYNFLWLFSYVGSASGRRSVQLKRDHEDTNAIATENRVSTLHYHPWESKCSKIITREKSIKAMTKDSYTPMTRLISHAVERVTTDTECLPTLIPAKAVKIETFNIKQAPRRSGNFILLLFL